jgi:hypothetical protein
MTHEQIKTLQRLVAVSDAANDKRDVQFARMNAVAIEIRDRLGVEAIAAEPNEYGNAKSYHFDGTISERRSPFSSSVIGRDELSERHSGDFAVLCAADMMWRDSVFAAQRTTRELCEFLAELTGMKWQP